jgi:1-acyl-sn-glycerol-3-phosphate acyltransferase
MYVANHQGLLDALLLLGILRNTVALIKTKHASKHIYAKLVKYMHFLAVEAGSREQIGQAFIKAGVVLGQNQSILVFPEGTRSSGKRLLPFKEFAFKIAQHHQIPIVPIVIQMTSPILSKKLSTIFPTKKILYTIRFLKPVFPELSIPSTDLAAETRKIMTKELEAISEKNNEGKQP